ncbi:hypothetical protein A8B78_16380 [Jannaschia sp. EhC01]|nr:hypothetical protein A8B78_16380 [Jannaschia sp. EhC01]
MPRRRRTLLLGLTFFLVGLAWSVWGWSVGWSEMHLGPSERTRTLLEIPLAFIVVGILTIIGSRFIREDP